MRLLNLQNVIKFRSCLRLCDEILLKFVDMRAVASAGTGTALTLGAIVVAVVILIIFAVSVTMLRAPCPITWLFLCF